MSDPVRTPLPDFRKGITRKFEIPYVHKDGSKDKLKLYITANTDDDGKLREVFIKADKMGGLASGALDAIATMISIALQYGIPLEVLTSKLRNNRYGPSGFLGDPEFKSCSSPFDLIAQFLDSRFGAKLINGEG
jgi:ribonucleoside-diphosphate reductase alpha chain